MAQYETVLQMDPANKSAAKGMADLSLQMKKFDKAKELYRRAIAIDPEDPELYYSIGVIDWTQSYQPRMELRAKLGLKPEQPLIRKGECWQVRETNQAFIADGMQMLQIALEKRNDYDDAMAYMNLMYRERADIQCEDPRARAPT